MSLLAPDEPLVELFFRSHFESVKAASKRSSAPSSGWSAGLEQATQRWAGKIFAQMDLASSRHPHRVDDALLKLAFQNPELKARLFRLVDALPSLGSSGEIAGHVRAYLAPEQGQLGIGWRLALRAGLLSPPLLARVVKQQVTKMARRFMLPMQPAILIRDLQRLKSAGVGFTVDILGETVLSETEADEYAARCMQILDLLSGTVPNSQPAANPASFIDGNPEVNLSVKISALYSQIQPVDPEKAIQILSSRLRPILRRAQTLGALINFDMESYALKDLTLALFQTIFSESEFNDGPACGIALQAYLRDAERDLLQLIAWGKKNQRSFTVRLVKGAYWDYETIIAGQKHWPLPVFSSKAETDANFELLAGILLQNAGHVRAAFGTHNVRSIAAVLAQAESLAIERERFEFQMLRGMADPVKSAVLKLGFPLREYCPCGEILPGMAYLVRRLLENTSNEGFLAQSFLQGAERRELIRDPRAFMHKPKPHLRILGHHDVEFQNEPPVDFRLEQERVRIRDAIAQVRARGPQKHRLVIGGKPIRTSEWLPSLNPANQQEVIGYAAQAGIEQAEAAIAAARAAQPLWARTPADKRAALLLKAAALLQRDRSYLTALEILEAGKNWVEADADLAEAIDFCRYYAAILREMAQPQRTQKTPGESNLQHWVPRGAGVVIAPWNFPLAILTGMTAAAVVTGNTVIIKPSDLTPVLGAQLMDILQQAGFPAGVLNLLTGPGSTVGAHLVAHPQLQFIAFTGSREVGLKIWEAAGRTLPGQEQLKRVVCEMGGKNAVIVDSDADLDEAVAGCLASAFGYQGQKCSALSRLIVVEPIRQRFLERLIPAAASLRVGPAEVPGTIIGPVICRSAQQRILKIIEDGKSDANILWQGQVPNEPDACYVPPTIFVDVPPQSRLFREEIFGPVLAITKGKDFTEAVALANDSEFAMTGGCYSRHPEHLRKAAEEMVCGNLYLNRSITGALVQRQPFGGFKMSGGGTKAGGKEYLQQFLIPRVITENLMRRGFAPEE
jgi:RHH-type transcriptional regulator, proline utilization regulon repressor / proline dehydrogenase / delta 1-pyrroline-5-carboxylate dehydrogenase